MSRDNWFFLAIASFVWLVVAVVILHGQAPSAPGAPLAATATISVLVDGQPVASGSVINIQSGAGVIAHASPDPARNGTDITFDADTGMMLALQTDQAGVDHALVATTPQGAQSYVAHLQPPLMVYTPGQWFVMIPNPSPTLAGATINIDGVGPIALQGTCSQICLLLYLPGSPAVMVVH